MKTFNRKSGYSLVEMIIYVTLLSVVFFIIVNTVLSFTGSYKSVLALRIVDNSAVDAMEKMTRDIRGATSVDAGNSTLGSSPGVLTLISNSGGSTKTTKFYVQNGVLKADVNGSYFGPVTLSKATVTSLVFTKIESGISTGIKIDMTISGTAGAVTKTKNYHSTIVLKGF